MKTNRNTLRVVLACTLLTVVARYAVADGVSISPASGSIFLINSTVPLAGSGGYSEAPEGEPCCRDEAALEERSYVDVYGDPVEEVSPPSEESPGSYRLDTAQSTAADDKLVHADYRAIWVCPEAPRVDWSEHPPIPGQSTTSTYTAFSISCKEIGFTGDHMMTNFESEQEIDSPDGSEKTWDAEGGMIWPVAYTRETTATMFDKFEVSPNVGTHSTNVTLLAFNGDTQIGRQNLLVTGGEAEFGGFGVTETFENAVKEIEKSYTWKAKQGEHVEPAGGSGHTIYLTEATPTATPVYDKTAKQVAGSAKDLPQPAPPDKITEKLMDDIAAKMAEIPTPGKIYYNPAGTSSYGNIIKEVWEATTASQIDCHAMTDLLIALRGHTTGGGHPTKIWGNEVISTVDHFCVYHFGTLDVTFRMNHNVAKGAAPALPHFYIHSVFTMTTPTGDRDYDPVYKWHGADARTLAIETSQMPIVPPLLPTYAPMQRDQFAPASQSSIQRWKCPH